MLDRVAWVALALFLLVGAAVGCGDSSPIAPVSGVVTLDGEPLSDAIIGFEPIAEEGQLKAGYGSYGRTDAEGRYTLRYLETKEDGALIGTHRVSISTVTGREGPNGEMMGLTAERVPPRYNNDTELTYEVPPEGTDQANLELTSR